MKHTYELWTRATALVLALVLVAGSSAAAQGWKKPTGSAQAAWVSAGGATPTVVASAALPDGGGVARAEQDAIQIGALSGRTGTSVTSGDQSLELLGVQSVATVADVSILDGRITASRVIAIATLSDQGVQSAAADGDGSTITGLVIDGVPYDGASVAPNTRVDLPGAGYVILNERLAGKGRGTELTVNMIHVVMSDGGEIVVASATSGNGK